jgi:hypothetical protein
MEGAAYATRFHCQDAMDESPPLLSGIDEDAVEEIVQHTR